MGIFLEVLNRNNKNYKIILNSDSLSNGGFDRVDEPLSIKTDKHGKLSIYLPNRCCMALIAQ